MTDAAWMKVALEQAALALAEGNLPIGAAIVHEGSIVAVGRNGIESDSDDTRHAELVAIQAIPGFLFEHKRRCTIYTTLEPCMMCLGAIVNVGITRVVFGARDRLVGATGLLPHGDYYRRKGLDLVSGVSAAESQALINEYVRRTGRRAHMSTERA